MSTFFNWSAFNALMKPYLYLILRENLRHWILLSDSCMLGDNLIIYQPCQLSPFCRHLWLMIAYTSVKLISIHFHLQYQTRRKLSPTRNWIFTSQRVLIIRVAAKLSQNKHKHSWEHKKFPRKNKLLPFFWLYACQLSEESEVRAFF